MDKTYAYLGSFNYDKAEGLSVCSYDAKAGTFELKQTLNLDINAGSLEFNGDLLYATDERQGNPEMGGQGGGRVFTFKINPVDGSLTELSRLHTLVANPASVVLDSHKKYLIVSHFAIDEPITKIIKDVTGEYHAVTEFNDTTINLYKLNDDNTPGECVDVLKLPTAGKPLRQSLVHRVFESPISGVYGFCNLGIDEVSLLKLDYDHEKLVVLDSVATPKGTGPRHLVFHPTLPFAYCNYEHHGVVSTFQYTQNSLEFVRNQRVFDEHSMTADDNQSEILISKNGGYLYDVVRGTGEVIVFSIDQQTGALDEIQRVQLSGQVPRVAAFSPDAQFLLVTLNDLQCIVTYKINDDGTLSEQLNQCDVTHPGSLGFYSPNK